MRSYESLHKGINYSTLHSPLGWRQVSFLESAKLILLDFDRPSLMLFKGTIISPHKLPFTKAKQLIMGEMGLLVLNYQPKVLSLRGIKMFQNEEDITE